MQPVTQWTLDPAHTNVEFAVRHLMIAKVKGKFTKVRGTVTTRGEDLSTAQVEATLEASSITTGNEQRDAHLRSGDFLDAERFPELRFRSHEGGAAGRRELSVAGRSYHQRHHPADRAVGRSSGTRAGPLGRLSDPDSLHPACSIGKTSG